MSDKENPLVSVIIPCYKQAHFLSEAIESVLRQTYRNVETIVIDDGSPDNTSEVAARYAEVKCVRQENRGLSGARNRGIAESKGEYLVFLDADDRLLPHALETNLRCLLDHPECAFSCGHRVDIAADGTPLPTNLWPCVDSEHYLHLLRRNYIGPPAVVMYRRWVFNEVGLFDEKRNAAEDWDMYLRIARLHPIHCHHRVIVEYRIHSTSMSRKPAMMLSACSSVLRAQKKYVKGNSKYEEAYKAGYKHVREIDGEKLVNQIRKQVRAGDWLGASFNVRILIRYYPTGVVHHALRKLRRVLFNLKGNDDLEESYPEKLEQERSKYQ
jgi:glycosyltransferase involved in cell wall biosynthesis